MIGVAYDCLAKQMMIYWATAEQKEQPSNVSRELLPWYNAEKIFNCEHPELFLDTAPARVSLHRRLARWIRGVIVRFTQKKNPAQTRREVSAWQGAKASGAARVQ